ncbi:MAG: hypothetical protein U5K76_09220 [Woeseiaceae bacterium]|nr:hypothetical protein [Woeseiaceae bacterium]
MQRLLNLAWIPVMIIVIAGARPATAMDAAAAAASTTGVKREFLKYWQPPGGAVQEDYIAEPMPPGFQVVVAPLEGPVFADPQGQTLYTWPLRSQRNGYAGDRPGRPSSCTDEVLRVRPVS